MSRSAILVVLCLLLSGCAVAPTLETQAYQLQDRESEVLLINGVLQDELSRIGKKKMLQAVNENGGRLRAVDITEGNVAIVRTTVHGHHAISRALIQLREQSPSANR